MSLCNRYNVMAYLKAYMGGTDGFGLTKIRGLHARQ